MPLRLSLIAKLSLAISLILLATMGLFAYINVEQLEKLLYEEAVIDADKLSETIIRTTHYHMLENNLKRAYQIIDEVGSQRGIIDRIRMVNKFGLVTHSTDSKEKGLYLDKKAEACSMCHSGPSPLVHATTMNRSRLFTNREGREVLGLAKAIYNEERCYTAPCHFHPKEAKVLGVLDVIVSLDQMHQKVYAYRNEIIVLTVLQIGLIAICLTFLTQRLVNRPVRALVHHAHLIGGGDLDATVKVKNRDELGELADAFNGMTKNLKKARVELEDWGKNLEDKVEERTQEIKKIQSQLVHSEKLASLGELVAGIAHEINNPLTGILVFASLLASDSKLDPSLKGDLDLIVKETQRCARIVKGLLDFSRESMPQKKPSSLNAIMDATLTLVCNQSSFHDINVIKEYNPDIPEMNLDPNQIEQVFINLLLNACHAIGGPGEIRIRTGFDQEREEAYAAITDNGCGIPEEHLSKIFDPFFSTKENKGTGLGLSVSYGIIEGHGGRIEVRSTVGAGTTFTCWLPINHDRAPAAAEATAVNQTAPVPESS
ncbi:sensor histidine kinase [Geobacter hydrogenophilus]|uniref:histidine kinase n=1 Tax=Geobacter hydrogenophilus TaxID=40983 RepID=A0A9W6FZ35_9BACT|nr:HAMP domain-containing sensor histidine kinase [Geobacter hydrogenophilus]GLI37418.1 two-component sensor histidine kinase [Geobacter hydrogenophilus]